MHECARVIGLRGCTSNQDQCQRRAGLGKRARAQIFLRSVLQWGTIDRLLTVFYSYVLHTWNVLFLVWTAPWEASRDTIYFQTIFLVNERSLIARKMSVRKLSGSHQNFPSLKSESFANLKFCRKINQELP